MEFDFQCAVNSVLEWGSRNTNLSSADLTNALEKQLGDILEYHGKCSIEVKRALERVLFRAWYRREGYDSDFAVSRYKRGLECAEFVRLTKYFDLQDFIKIRLYTHPAEEAVVILGDIMDADVSSASQYVLQYLRISGGIVNADLRAQSLQYLVDHDALRMHDDGMILQTLDLLREQLSAMKDKHQQTVKNALIDIISAIFTLADRKALESWPVQGVLREIINDDISCSVLSEYISSDSTPLIATTTERLHVATDRRPVKYLRAQWKEIATHLSSEKSLYIQHTQTFVKLYHYIQRHTVPIPTFTAREANKSSYVTISNDAYQATMSIINRRQDDIELIKCKQLCLQSLYGQYPGWKSIFKAMIQFADLWIEEFSLPEASAEFARLIYEGHLEKEYFLCFLKIAFGAPPINVPRNKTGKMFSFLLRIAHSMEDENRLLAFRDYTYNTLTQSWTYTYDLTSLVQESKMDVHKEITKVSNKFTSEPDTDTLEEDVPMPDLASTAKHLIVLSILCPYGVVYELVSLSLQNQKQTNAIVSVLGRLGNLCRLSVQVDSKTSALLNVCLEDAINSIPDDSFEDQILKIKTFVANAVPSKGELEAIPPLVLLGGESDEFTESLVDINDLAKYAASLLESFCNPSSMEADRDRLNATLALEIMDVLLSSIPSNDSRSYSEIVNLALAKYPLMPTRPLVELHCRYIRLLSRLQCQYRREKLTGRERELTMHLRDCITTILEQYVYEPSCSKVLRRTLLDISRLEWHANFMWYGLYQVLRDSASNAEPRLQPLPVPKAMTDLVGTLGGKLQVAPDITQNDGWLALIEACVLSSDFTSTLLQEKEEWIYNLSLLWKHPNDDEILAPCLQKVLLGFNSERDYRTLVVDFLSQLFDTYEIAADIIRKYPYSVPEMHHFARLLRDPEAKIFFLCLYSLRIFNLSYDDPTLQMQFKLYQANMIAKTLQNCHAWTVIDHEPTYSARRLKELALTNSVAKANLAPGFHNEGRMDTSLEEETTTTPIAEELNSLEDTGEQSSATRIVHLYFPFYTNQNTSLRSLHVLVLYCLLYMCIKLGVVTDSIRVLLFQIVQGLCDDPKRRLFREVIQNQTKVQMRLWNQAKGRKVKVHLRPILSEQEAEWIGPLVQNLPDAMQAHALYTSLELDDNPQRRIERERRAIYLTPKK